MLHRHAGVYAIVNVGLLVLGLALLTFTPWWIWFLPAVLWGVGLAIHALVALTANEDDWKEHHAGMEVWKEDRARGHELALARAAERRARGGRDEARRRRAKLRGCVSMPARAAAESSRRRTRRCCPPIWRRST